MATSLQEMTPRSRRLDAPVPPWRAFMVPQPSVTDLTVGEVARLWLEHVERRGRRSMRDARSAISAHLVPSFGDLAARELGVPRPAAGPRKMHCARHTFISLLARAGVPEETRKTMTHTTTHGDDAHSAYVWLDWPTLCDGVCRLGVGP